MIILINEVVGYQSGEYIDYNGSPKGSHISPYWLSNNTHGLLHTGHSILIFSPIQYTHSITEGYRYAPSHAKLDLIT